MVSGTTSRRPSAQGRSAVSGAGFPALPAYCTVGAYAVSSASGRRPDNHLPLTQHPHPFPEQLALAGAFTVILLACCSLSYRFIEAPMQRQAGIRGLAGVRFGPDSIPAHVEAPDSSRSAVEAPAAHAGTAHAGAAHAGAAHAGAAHAGAAPDARAPASSGAR